MSELESILLKYHANDLPKPQAMALIQDLIDAERITLRDELAGQALNGLLANHDFPRDTKGKSVLNFLAECAYDYSDAMLERRKK